VFKEIVGGILFTACDAMGAVAGDAWLKNKNLPLIALGGVLTASPLQRDEASKATGLPIFSRQDLAGAKTAIEVLTLAESRGPQEARAGSRAKWRSRRELNLHMSVASEPSDQGLTSEVSAHK
jgi:hypothetical protein